MLSWNEAMLDHLLWSRPVRRTDSSATRNLAVSVGVHFLAISGGAFLSSYLMGSTPEVEEEGVSFFEVVSMEEFDPAPEDASPDPEEPEPEPAPPEFEPELPEDVEPDSELLAGFQELLEPDETPELPQEVSDGAAVREADFRGRGLAGGVAHGQRLQPAVAILATPGESGPEPIRLPDAVTNPPALLNGADVSRIMSSFYPPMLQGRGEGGVVLAQFVVTAAGRVDPESIEIVESAHPALEAATMRFLRELRFEPGDLDGRAVPVLVRFPVTWAVTM